MKIKIFQLDQGSRKPIGILDTSDLDKSTVSGFLLDAVNKAISKPLQLRGGYKTKEGIVETTHSVTFQKEPYEFLSVFLEKPINGQYYQVEK